MKLTEHIANSRKFGAPKKEMTLAEADMTKSGSSPRSAVALIRRLAESKNNDAKDSKPGFRNPSVLCS